MALVAIFQPLALLAAVFALIAAQCWWAVATVTNRHGGDAGRVSRKLHLAAISTAIALALGAASVVALPIVGLLT